MTDRTIRPPRSKWLFRAVTSREPERDPLEGPYRVADDIVEREVDQLVDRDHGGTVPARKRADMAEAVTERLAGNMNE